MNNSEPANKNFIKTHPCFTEEAHTRFSRAHLSVAPACNIQCRYCIRKYDCANESRPGITSKVLTPDEAVERTRVLVERSDRLSVVGIAGPGDPLANAPTFETMRNIHSRVPRPYPLRIDERPSPAGTAGAAHRVGCAQSDRYDQCGNAGDRGEGLSVGHLPGKAIRGEGGGGTAAREPVAAALKRPFTPVLS